ncbi:pyridoxamine 5'-phosphate oxidase [uncultured Jatrophihabitans sp.]|uniref:pyridoxamine 5'-phosphate oxidase n=1 Tax=uncultured Jatrophihabitans sp. TaxID=1610747 RepID=UPI0035CA0D4E
MARMSDPAALRVSYEHGRLDDDGLPDAWPPLLQAWFATAAADPAVREPNAIQLATVDAAGRPAVRTVLAKAIDARGVVFYTNYDSAKARELAARPLASAVFAWLAHERQVRLTGPVAKVERAETEAYFASRPRGSQLGAWASPQSSVVASRAELDARYADAAARFGDREIPAPPGWGGFRLSPDAVEFWQGRPSRLHDRVRFRLADDGWVRERLAP